MKNLTDQELLRGYAEHRYEAHFAELVRRHVNLVYSVALRIVCDRHLAEDVAQAAFMALARNAGQLSKKTHLAAWLYATTRNLATKTVRSEVRRHAREEKFVFSSELFAAQPNLFHEHLAPHLDAALDALSDEDRGAILLRYFEGMSAQEMAQALGTSEAAAQKRVSRAVERLRDHLIKHGADLSPSALLGSLGATSTEAAPPGLALAISSKALSLAGAITAQSIRSVSIVTPKLIAAVAIVTLSFSAMLLWRQNLALRQEINTLQASARKESLSADATSDPGALITGNELRRLRLEHLELLSLRGRIRQLSDALRERQSDRLARANGEITTQALDANSFLFSARTTNHVSNGNTLIVGGWTTRDGLRRYALARAVIEGTGETGRLSIFWRVIAAPERFWEQLGWRTAKSDTPQSTIVTEFTPEDVSALFAALKGEQRVEISNECQSERQSGEYLGMALSYSDEQGAGVMMCMDVYPRIAADGISADLEFRPPAAPITAKVHPSLFSAEAAPQPPAR